MADASGRSGSRIVAMVVLAFAVINLLFLGTEIAINVLGAMLPL
jgi:hypothetical protein